MWQTVAVLSRICRTDIILLLLLVPVLCVCLCEKWEYAATNVQSNSHFSFYCDGYCNAFSALNRRVRSCVVYIFGVLATHKNVFVGWIVDMRWLLPSPISFTHSLPSTLFSLSFLAAVNAHKYHTKFMLPNNKMDDQRSAFNSTAPSTDNISVAACLDFIILKHFFSHSRTTTTTTMKKNVQWQVL